MGVNKSEKNIKVDVYDSSALVIRAKQYDTLSRYINITCTNCGTVLDITPSTCYAMVKVITPDNRAIHNTATVNSNGTITVELTKSILNYAGVGYMEVNIYSKSDKSLLTTMTMKLVIEKSVYDDNREIGSDEYNALVDLLTKLLNTETNLKNAEAKRVTAENARVSAESKRVTAENNRVTAENKRASAETARANAESARVTAENARVTAENNRVSAEKARVTAETNRASAETARAEAESARVTAENSRVSAEKARVTAENARATAESNRASTFNTLKTNMETATSAAEKVNISSTSDTDSYKITITNRSGTSTTSPNLLNKLSIGTVTTNNSESGSASASITGSFGSQKLNLTLPRGYHGNGIYLYNGTLSKSATICAKSNITSTLYSQIFTGELILDSSGNLFSVTRNISVSGSTSFSIKYLYSLGTETLSYMDTSELAAMFK